MNISPETSDFSPYSTDRYRHGSPDSLRSERGGIPDSTKSRRTPVEIVHRSVRIRGFDVQFRGSVFLCMQPRGGAHDHPSTHSIDGDVTLPPGTPMRRSAGAGAICHTTGNRRHTVLRLAPAIKIYATESHIHVAEPCATYQPKDSFSTPLLHKVRHHKLAEISHSRREHTGVTLMSSGCRGRVLSCTSTMAPG